MTAAQRSHTKFYWTSLSAALALSNARKPHSELCDKLPNRRFRRNSGAGTAIVNFSISRGGILGKKTNSVIDRLRLIEVSDLAKRIEQFNADTFEF